MTLLEELAVIRAENEDLKATLAWYAERDAAMVFELPEAMAAAFTRVEGRVVAALLRRKGRVVGYDALVSIVWPGDEDKTARNLSPHIHHIKKKLPRFGLKLVVARCMGFALRDEDELPPLET